VVVGGQVGLVVGLLSREIGNLAELDVVAADDHVLRLLDLLLCLVELRLGVGALLQGSEFKIVSREGVENLAEFLLCLQKGV
jgi:hypothetical protein